jgi:hypothetical protein
MVMTARKTAASVPATSSDARAALLRQYGSGPVELTGNPDAIYERHLLFDNVALPAATGPRERYEAFARSVRDFLSQRWLLTDETYEKATPKRVYYLSMEFLIGRSLANNITNLRVGPLVSDVVEQSSLDWLSLLEQEPDAGLGNGGLGRLAACFLDSMATMQLPAMGYGLRVRVRDVPAIHREGMAARTARATAPQRPAHRGALQPIAREPGTGDDAADVPGRGQGSARLPPGQAHHQAPEQPRRHHRRRSGGSGAAQGPVAARLLGIIGRAADPAADVSNQISTAGYEASGTSNMKFMMNGALTVGTRDGATIEMAEEAGEENFFLFGLTAEQVAGSRGWYNPRWHYDHQPEIRAALDLIFSDDFSRDEPGIFEAMHDVLLTRDCYMHLADLASFLEVHGKLAALYRDPDAWARKAILNVAGSGRFSSDRTIAQYAADIWHAQPCPVP